MCCEILLVLLNYVGCSRKWPVNCPSAVGAAAAGLCYLSGDPSADSTAARISTGLFPYRTTAASDTCEELSVVLFWLSTCRNSETLSPNQTQNRIGSEPKSSHSPGLYSGELSLPGFFRTGTDNRTYGQEAAQWDSEVQPGSYGVLAEITIVELINPQNRWVKRMQSMHQYE